MSSLSDVRFDLIRYANCWEDADVLLRALHPLSGARVLSVASGGDNSLALLAADPALVVATDVSAIQLYVIELKVAAMRRLSRDAYLAFVGFRPSNRRWLTFRALERGLGAAARAFFSRQRPLIERGIVHGGKFERYARFFARYVVPLVHSRRQVARLLEPKTAEAQEEFYRQVWDSWRWRALFRVFFSRTVLGRFGRDPQFMRQVEVPVGQFLYERMRVALSGAGCSSNYMIHYFLTGNFGATDATLPMYVQPGVYERVQANLDRLQLVHDYAEAAARRHGPFDAFNLSNIFEYMDVDTFRRTGEGLLGAAAPGARMAYWNLMAPRALDSLFPARLEPDAAWAGVLRDGDRGFFYGDFRVESVLPVAVAEPAQTK